jgi:hypothetical protein
MLDLSYDYETCVRNSEKVAWRIDDVMPPGTRLDFQKPFLPAKLAGADTPAFLSDDDRRKLNQINGNAYLNLFAFVEEYILAMAVQHAQAEMFGDHHAIRALLRFGEEEAKHQRLFIRYKEAFDRDFGHACEVLGSAAEVANVILSKSSIAVTMVTLHLEIMTQQHYTECVRDDTSVDPFFASLLKHHWLEESQHARIDALELEKLVSAVTPEAIETAFQDYVDLIGAFDGLLRSQADMDARSLGVALGRTFSGEELKQIGDAQHRGYRRTFLTMGMTNPMFETVVRKISPEGALRVKATAEALA